MTLSGLILPIPPPSSYDASTLRAISLLPLPLLTQIAYYAQWTVAEEEYSARIIQLFEYGVLNNVENVSSPPHSTLHLLPQLTSRSLPPFNFLA